MKARWAFRAEPGPSPQARRWHGAAVTDEVVSRTKTVWFNILRIRNAHGGRLPPLRIGRGLLAWDGGFFVYAGFMAAGCRRYGLGAGLLARNEVFFVYASFWRPGGRRYGGRSCFHLRSGGVCAAKAFPRLTSDHTNTKRSRNPFRPSCAGRFCLVCRRFFRRRRGPPRCPLSTKGSFSFCPAP